MSYANAASKGPKQSPEDVGSKSSQDTAKTLSIVAVANKSIGVSEPFLVPHSLASRTRDIKVLVFVNSVLPLALTHRERA